MHEAQLYVSGVGPATLVSHSVLSCSCHDVGVLCDVVCYDFESLWSLELKSFCGHFHFMERFSAGLHLHHRMLHILTPAELKAIHPKRKLRPYVAAAPHEIAEQNTEDPAAIQYSDAAGHSNALFGAASCTYIWGALLRIDVLEAPVDTRFVFFGTGQMQVYACRLIREDEILEFEEHEEDTAEGHVARGDSGGKIVPGWDYADDAATFGAASVAARGGLRVARVAEIPTPECMMTVADVTMSGMPGWVSIVSGSQGCVRLRVWAPRGVEVHLRPPIPCPTPVAVAPVW
jgi:nitric-oxide synthase, plant